MRVALFSDIHGNSIALEAVLEDIQRRGGVDAYWCLGDLVAIGPDPIRVMEQLAELSNLVCVRGNTDSYLTAGTRPYPTAEQARVNPQLVERYGEVQAQFAWTQGAVHAAGWMNWLAAWELEQRITLPDGTRALLVHVAPRQEDGTGIHPNLTQEELAGLVTGCNANLLLVGHTHWQHETSVEGLRIVNVGSVSIPLAPDLRASYTILEADASGYRLTQHRVEYDRQAVIEMTVRVKHPAADFIITSLRGERIPSWMKK